LQGDLGKGIQYKIPVIELIGPRLWNSIMLAAVSMVMAVLPALPLGVLAAVKRGQLWDRIAMGIGLGGQSLPSFWLALILVLIFAVRLKPLPASGIGTWHHFILPSFTLGWFISAGATRLVRSSMLEVLDTEYVKLARSKGVAEAVGDLEARAAERADPCGDLHRLYVWRHHRLVHYSRDRVRLAWHRSVSV